MQRYLFVIITSMTFWIFSWLFSKRIGEQFGFGLNRTASQSPGIYIYFPINSPLKTGDLVDCDLDFSQYSLKWIKQRCYLEKNRKLLKNIGAIPGDWLFTIYSDIYVCKSSHFTKNCIILGSCMREDKNGFPLSCQVWHGKEIPNDYFYLKSNRVLNSFDSRYFGLVHIKNIHHRLKIIMDFS